MDDDGLLSGRYRLGEVRGRGGAATVYAAIDVMLGREVAVKLFRPAESRVGLYRFAAEARLLAGLSHPGLVTVYDVDLDGDRPYLVMRLVAGDTVRRLLDRGPVDPVGTARIGARVAEVLAYIHTRDVVHRDVKPSNVLVDAAGECYLADFGIARAIGAAHFTMSGELVGTAGYLAPEQVTDTDTGPKADVYSLGLVLLECLTGEPEYTGTTVESAVARLSRQPRVPAELPAGWRTLLTAMTAQDPDRRPTAARCAEHLTALAENRATAPFPSGARRFGPLHAGLSAAVLAGAVLLGLAAATTVVPGVPTGGDTAPATSQPAADSPTEEAAEQPPARTEVPVEPAGANPPPVQPVQPAQPGAKPTKDKPDKPKPPNGNGNGQANNPGNRNNVPGPSNQ